MRAVSHRYPRAGSHRFMGEAMPGAPAGQTSGRRVDRVGKPLPARRTGCFWPVRRTRLGIRGVPRRESAPCVQENEVPLRAMGVSQRLKSRFRKFLQRPGTTVDLAPFRKRLPAIEAREEPLRELDDEALTAAAGEASDFTEICAIGREAAWRALEQRPYDVQLLGAMALLSGKVAEMATGEGKTLTATIAAYGHVRQRPRAGARADRQRLSGPPRRRVDGAGLQAARPDRRLGRPSRPPRRSAARRTRPTSRTSRSARPASTTCATSWSPTSRTGFSASWPPRSSTRPTRS